ncbi:hypothetical protein AX768_19840 [Burkholderia sp. PAMC 28687]|nr:hypothetical protein AX768_19840 [Burkholderia sp. PAMC 28687]
MGNDAYTLAFASMLLTGGTLGDRWGARNVYFAGLVMFTLASSICGLAPGLPSLIAARVLQGVGAAMLVPCSLKLINHACPDPEQRARAVGIWVGCGGVAMAAGPLIGGVLIHLFDWRSIFYVNVPIGLVGLWMTWHIASDERPAEVGRFDPLGQVTAIVALGALIGVLISGRSIGVVGDDDCPSPHIPPYQVPGLQLLIGGSDGGTADAQLPGVRAV